MLYVGDGRKKPETKKFSVWLPSHPPSTIWRPSLRTPKTSQTYPQWKRDLI